MIKTQNHIGTISLSAVYLKRLIGKTASDCFGVVGMDECSPAQKIRCKLKGPQTDNGVVIRVKNNKLIIDLHISVSYGVNISAVSESIVNKVRFAVENETGTEVNKVNVFIENMIS